MGLSEFILLGEKEKKWTVLHQGILVGKRENSNRKVFLFQMEDYYVETFCNPQNKSIEEYRVFTNTRSLSPYLPTIPLDDLFN
ncbi:MAG: hypothetical protein M3Q06_13290 [Bacteroidota bacterium]|nr:hypothetical protein [Bacteroidota bacterium]